MCRIKLNTKPVFQSCVEGYARKKKIYCTLLPTIFKVCIWKIISDEIILKDTNGDFFTFYFSKKAKDL